MRASPETIEITVPLRVLPGFSRRSGRLWWIIGRDPDTSAASVALSRHQPFRMDRVLNPAPVRKLQVTNLPDRLNNPTETPNRSRLAGPGVVAATATSPRASQGGVIPAMGRPAEAPPQPSGIRR